MLNSEKLKEECLKLKELLSKYSEHESVAGECLAELEEVFTKVLNEKFIKPYKNLPCSYHFHEGELRRFHDLEEAYSKFAFRIEGGDENEMNKFFDSLDE